MNVRPFKLDILWVFALSASAAFASFIAGQNWLLAAGLAGGIAILLIGLTSYVLLIVIWIVGTPTLFVFVNSLLTAMPAVTVERALFVVLAGLLVARLIFQPSSLKRLDGVEKAMGLYLAVIVVSWMTTLGDKQSADIKMDVYLLVQGFLMPFTAYVIARNIEWSEPLIKAFLWSLLLVGVFQAAAGFVQQFLGWEVTLSAKSILEHPDRMTGTFGNSLTYGIVLAIVLFMALFLLAHAADPLHRTLLAGLVLALLVCILFSKGRGVWLAVALCFLFVTWRTPRIRPIIVGGALIGGLLLPFVLPFVIDFDDFGSRLKDSASIYNRVALYATALNMFLNRPIFGFGFGVETFKDNKAGFYDTWGAVPADYAAWPAVPHNELLHILVLMGLVGLIAYAILTFVSIRMLIRNGRRFRASDPFFAEFGDFVLAAFAVAFINQLFMDMMFNSYIMFLLFFLLGIVGSRQTPGDLVTDSAGSGSRETVPSR